MKILQFRCLQDPPATQLKQLVIDQANTWSRLQRLSNDPNYTTNPFSIDLWKPHITIAGLHWLNYDSIYNNLGDDGRLIADQMLGDGPLRGILKNAPLVNALPDSKLEVVEVSDLVTAGYLPEPESLEP